jgi:hypothetical protein
MANEDHLVWIKQGVTVWNKWREENPDSVPDLIRVDLRSANLRSANLRRADLSDVQLSLANLGGANLSGANLSGASLFDAALINTVLINADLTDAVLSGANLSGADLSDANLTKAKLCDADLRMAALIDSRLDGADLTGAKLWETQHGGWSIKGIMCKRVFWDRDGQEPNEYEDGAFERIFAKKPRIVLRYAGGMSPVDLAMLPLIIERLQAEHPDSSLHILSVEDDGNGATVTITVEDLADRSNEAFAQDVETLRGDLVMVQQRLQQEERLRLTFEAKYSAVIHDILPMMMERALPKTEVNIGQITGPTTIEGTTMSKDTYKGRKAQPCGIVR